MSIVQTAVTFALALMDQTNNKLPYDIQFVTESVESIASVSSDLSEIETLIKIARWESGGFRKEVINCKIKGDHGDAHGMFQVHPWNPEEKKDCCDPNIAVQAKVALSRVRISINMCKRFGKTGADLLTGYTVGHCVSNNMEANMRWGNGKALQKLIDLGN